MGLLDFLSPALTTATQAASAYQGAQAKSAEDQQQEVRNRLLQQKQQKEQELKDALTRAQTGEATARIGDIQSQQQQREYQLQHPKPIAKKYQYITGPDGSVSAVNEGDPTDVVSHLPGVQGKVEHAPQGPVPHFSIQNVTGSDGQIHLARVNSLTGDVTELPQLGRQPTGKGGPGGVMQQMVQQHYQSAKQADDRLNRFGGTIASHGQISNYIMGHNPFDSDLQQANQAGEEFATLIAPLVNRGRTTHIELDQIKKSYVPLASDSKETIAQKATSRKALLDAFAKEAGDARGVVSPAMTPGASAHPLKAKYGLE